jgi:hypothetical protein
MAFRRHPGYDDLSFTLQALDNTGTICEVDRDLLQAWVAERVIAHYDEDEATGHLSRYIVHLQLDGQLTELGSPRDQITIHQDAYAFVAQFLTDARDRDNRLAPVLCFGRLPRAADKDAAYRGINSLRTFLQRNGVGWRPSIQQRYLIVLRELPTSSGPGPRPIIPKPSLPRFRMPGFLSNTTDEEPVVRLGRRARQEPAGDSSEDVQAASSGVGGDPSAAQADEGTREPTSPPAPSAPPSPEAGDSVDIAGLKVVAPDEEKGPVTTSQKESPEPAFRQSDTEEPIPGPAIPDHSDKDRLPPSREEENND